MRGSEFAELCAFAAIVEHGSFTRAAKQLQVSPSALSQTIRGLEERLGVRLLNRTTRSVAPSDAGARLWARLGPTLTELEAAVTEVGALRDRPVGRLRINASRLATMRFLAPRLARFQRAYPDLALEIAVEDAITDIVARRFDAGIRLGERVQKDMVALPLGGELELMAVASPAYLAQHGTPATPRDLHRHRCINIRFNTDGSLYRWEFERGGRELEVAVEGHLTVNDSGLALQAALDGLGITYLIDEEVGPHVEAGRLVRVLASWSPRFPGFYLYYPSRRQMPAGLRVLIDFLRAEGVIQAPRSRGRRA